MGNSPKTSSAIVSRDNDDARERKWKAEDAHRDIVRAEQHRADKGLMKDVQVLHKQKQAELAAVKLVSNQNKK